MYAGPNPEGWLEVFSPHERTGAGPAKICRDSLHYSTFSQRVDRGCQRTGATDGANRQMRRELGKAEDIILRSCRLGGVKWGLYFVTLDYT